ncbi:MAG: type II toxin-antitoxin system HipA family toxin, partial [Bacteriovorax sp.]|nr:type II toxin-antitoxin system HipA family toxin [Bacteriovorax sp.]
SDFFEFADKADLKKNQAKKIIEQIIEVLSHWEIYADIGEVSAEHCEQIKKYIRVF